MVHRNFFQIFQKSRKREKKFQRKFLSEISIFFVCPQWLSKNDEIIYITFGVSGDSLWIKSDFLDEEIEKKYQREFWRLRKTFLLNLRSEGKILR